MSDDPDLALPGPRAPERLPLGVLHAPLARGFFGCTCVVSLVAAALVAGTQMGAHSGTVAALLVLNGLASLAALATPKHRLALAMTLSTVFGMVLIAVIALALEGPRAPHGLPLYGLMVYLLFSAAGRRAGVFGAAVALACLAVVHLSPWAPPPLADGLPVGLGAQLLGLAAGTFGGWVAVRLIERQTRLSDDREARFRQLLGVAADLYWESDRQHRIVVLAYARSGEPVPNAQRFLGQLPWRLPGVAIDADALDTLLADIGRDEAFAGVPLAFAEPGAPPRHWAVSGEPRHDAKGICTGYWGVATEVTQLRRAESELARTRSRYQELFGRNPSPLVLHRRGRVLDANPAALQLLGFTSLAQAFGHELLATFEPGPEVQRARERLAWLETQPVGSALPVTVYHLKVGDRELDLRSTAVLVDTDGGPAIMTIMADDTERRVAEEQLRGSKALLEHLVATSPDLITLTEAATGRYVMVNRSFERFSGWSAGEAVGRTSADLEIWHTPEEREAFVDAIRIGAAEPNRPIAFRNRDGRELRLLVSAARFVLDGREYLVINGRDVTESERQRLEHEAILDSASVGIAVTRRRVIANANRRLEEMLGWPPGGLVGQPTSVNWADAEAFDRAVAVLVPALERGESVAVEHELRRRDGSRFLASIHGRAVQPARMIETGFVWIIEDITERRQFEQQLARARDEAEAASRAKSAFLANTSHELRTPLNGILGLAQLAREPSLSEDKRQHYLDQIVGSAQMLSSVINDILDLSRIEAGKIAIEHADFDLGQLLRCMHRNFSAQAAERGLGFALDIASDCDGRVQGDSLRLGQVLTIYLNNALKFTEGGQVRLSVERIAGHGSDEPSGMAQGMRFVVSDSGRGIDDETKARLFKPFSQADDSTTRRHGGAGLGLAICQQLARLMGGEVGVESEPDQGARFWLEVPLPQARPAADPPAQPAGRSALDGALRPLAGLRVLMVEDHPVNMLIAVAMLERWGADVVQATDGALAVQAVRAARDGKAEPLDLVLMDIQMPTMSGYEATRVLRQEGVRLPIIAVTAAALVGEREQALAAGMDDFLTKPIDATKLLDGLLRWSGRG